VSAASREQRVAGFWLYLGRLLVLSVLTPAVVALIERRYLLAAASIAPMIPGSPVRRGLMTLLWELALLAYGIHERLVIYAALMLFQIVLWQAAARLARWVQREACLRDARP
jgi:hypothetical protein